MTQEKAIKLIENYATLLNNHIYMGRNAHPTPQLLKAYNDLLVGLVGPDTSEQVEDVTSN
jgi:hypothetical protein